MAEEWQKRIMPYDAAAEKSAIGAMLVASACIDDILVFFQIIADIGHEGRVYLENGKHGFPVNGVAFYL